MLYKGARIALTRASTAATGYQVCQLLAGGDRRGCPSQSICPATPRRPGGLPRPSRQAWAAILQPSLFLPSHIHGQLPEQRQRLAQRLAQREVTGHHGQEG